LLISAFIVILLACASRLPSYDFTHHVIFSAILGAVSAMLGMILSASLNLPSGPSIVVTQLVIFCGAIVYSQRIGVRAIQ
jgi:zinc transport system permease protein